MSEIKALEKLRESSHLDDNKWTIEENGDVVIMCGRAPGDPNAVNWGEQWREIADEIEREHAQRIAELNGAICERDGRIGSYERRNTELNDALKAICRRFGVSTEWSAEDAAKNVLEALERDYMELPVDADGVPVHIGDVLELEDSDGEIERRADGIGFQSFFAWKDGTGCYHMYEANRFRHFNPRTLEDLLEGFIADYDRWDDCSSGQDRMDERKELFAKYADEIREIIGGGE